MQVLLSAAHMYPNLPKESPRLSRKLTPPTREARPTVCMHSEIREI